MRTYSKKKPLGPEVILISAHNPTLHLAIVKLYASFASEPHACEVHRMARDELAKLESQGLLL